LFLSPQYLNEKLWIRIHIIANYMSNVLELCYFKEVITYICTCTCRGNVDLCEPFYLDVWSTIIKMGWTVFIRLQKHLFWSYLFSVYVYGSTSIDVYCETHYNVNSDHIYSVHVYGSTSIHVYCETHISSQNIMIHVQYMYFYF
jgi:hypothetical protein